MTSAYGTLTKKAFSSVDSLNSILEGLPENLEDITILTMEAVYQDLKDTRDELLSALRKVALANTTEQRTSGKTKSSSTLSDILVPMSESAKAKPPLTDVEWEQLVDSLTPGTSGVVVSPTTESVDDDCECFGNREYCGRCY